MSRKNSQENKNPHQPERFINRIDDEEQTGFSLKDGKNFRYDRFGGWFDEYENYYNNQGQPQIPHDASRFKDREDTDDMTGFSLKDGNIFKYDRYGGWSDEHGNYYNEFGKPAVCPYKRKQPEQKKVSEEKKMEEEKEEVKTNNEYSSSKPNEFGSESQNLRNEGNKIYKSLWENVHEITRQDRIQQCIQLYYEAIEAAENPEEESSALKNLSQSYLKKSEGLYVNAREKIQALKNALIQLNLCLIKGQNKDEKWKQDILNNKLPKIFEQIKESQELEEDDQRYQYLDEIFHNLPQCIEQAIQVKVDFCLYIRNFLFEAAIREFVKKNYQRAYKYIKESEQPTIVVQQCHAQLGIEDEDFEEMTEILFNYQFYIELVKDIDSQITIFQKSFIAESEEYDYETALDTLDFFKSIKRTCEKQKSYGKDIQEIEGISNCMIGIVLNKVLFRTGDSKAFLVSGVQQILTLNQFELTQKDYFKQAQKLYQVIQSKELKEKQEEEKKIRNEYLEIIKEDYEKLKKESEVSHQHFCKYIAENYKTKKMTETEFKLEESDTESRNMKKTCIKLIVFYHPDKHKKEDDEKNFYICSEITRFLTSINDTYKA